MKHTKGYYVISSSNSEASASACPPHEGGKNRFLFTGREWIRRIGIYDYRNRVYSPDLGRFLQTDPIRFDAGDGNIYRYVGNNAINAWDPLGLECIFKIRTKKEKVQDLGLDKQSFKVFEVTIAGGIGLQGQTGSIATIILTITFRVWRDVITDEYECTSECGGKTKMFKIYDGFQRSIVKTEFSYTTPLEDTSWADKYKQNPK